MRICLCFALVLFLLSPTFAEGRLDFTYRIDVDGDGIVTAGETAAVNTWILLGGSRSLLLLSSTWDGKNFNAASFFRNSRLKLGQKNSLIEGTYKSYNMADASPSLQISFEACNFLRGDANSDGVVDICDSIFINTYLLFECSPPINLDSLDVNDDGEVNATDSFFLQSYLFGDGASPAFPFPSAGLDPTFDSLVPQCAANFLGEEIAKLLESLVVQDQSFSVSHLWPSLDSLLVWDFDGDGWEDLIFRRRMSSGFYVLPALPKQQIQSSFSDSTNTTHCPVLTTHTDSQAESFLLRVSSAGLLETFSQGNGFSIAEFTLQLDIAAGDSFVSDSLSSTSQGNFLISRLGEVWMLREGSRRGSISARKIGLATLLDKDEAVFRVTTGPFSNSFLFVTNSNRLVLHNAGSIKLLSSDLLMVAKGESVEEFRECYIGGAKTYLLIKSMPSLRYSIQFFEWKAREGLQLLYSTSIQNSPSYIAQDPKGVAFGFVNSGGPIRWTLFKRDSFGNIQASENKSELKNRLQSTRFLSSKKKNHFFWATQYFIQ